MDNINEITIKLSGKMHIDEQLKLGQDVTLTLTGSIVKSDMGDNQDGKVNLGYTFKALTVEVQ